MKTLLCALALAFAFTLPSQADEPTPVSKSVQASWDYWLSQAHLVFPDSRNAESPLTQKALAIQTRFWQQANPACYSTTTAFLFYALAAKELGLAPVSETDLQKAHRMAYAELQQDLVGIRAALAQQAAAKPSPAPAGINHAAITNPYYRQAMSPQARAERERAEAESLRQNQMLQQTNALNDITLELQRLGR